MNDIKLCYKAEFEFGKLSKSNSVSIKNRVIYISKKDYTGKATKVYIAFDYVTKIQLAFSSDKDKLINMLNKFELGILDGI